MNKIIEINNDLFDCEYRRGIRQNLYYTTDGTNPTLTINGQGQLKVTGFKWLCYKLKSLFTGIHALTTKLSSCPSDAI